MVSVTALIAGVLGILLGITLVVTEEDGILENRQVYNFLERAVNVFVRFLLLLCLL